MFSDHSGRIWRYDPDSPSQMSKVLLGTVKRPQKVDSRARKPISQTRPNHDFESNIVFVISEPPLVGRVAGGARS